MDTHTYPGRGLSLSQLLFALNEELKRVTHSPSFTLEAVSQLDQDASAALASIREWRNSFTCVNSIPIDILSLIPTYLPAQKDRFHAASVCRHWRGTLLKHGALWSQLVLKKGEDYVSTLLERAKGSMLDIVVHGDAPAGTIQMISPCAHQTRYLEFIQTDWKDIRTFSEFNSGQLPLLRILKIFSPEAPNPCDQPNVATPSSPPNFRGSVNLEQFVITSAKLSSLSHFVFPNLTMFKLSSYSTEQCSASLLLNFLNASPTLQTVEVRISHRIDLRDVPQEMVVVLPNVKNFSLHSDGDMENVYTIAALILCPRARYTSLPHGETETRMNAHLRIFPTPFPWNAIVQQYMASPIEAVTVKIEHPQDEDMRCFLMFQSETAVVRLGFIVEVIGMDEDDLSMSHAEMHWGIFSQALTTIQDHPLLSHIKRLELEHWSVLEAFWTISVEDKVEELLGSLGPLDELTIRGCDLRILLSTFLDGSELEDSERPIIFPHIHQQICPGQIFQDLP
ncbi:hypothetical protein BJ322DRAFT_1025425 [Thelephora terrestris]|uniref:F-box domain-containing protein n=1 Tax=Thelephora terrestris TaxID=56493 RepID=A0A9P6H2I8_9AGAM|nr:hypothetical protein BJ322DRAFT_1025425 [Thelephora terrestris]